jgi:hypothetical protein
MRISELISDIRSNDLVLPEFQREYVWTREQAKQLFVSLTLKYPVGGLLFWKTQSPPELKNVQELPSKLGTVQVLLDGQQRLTTLYMLVTGEIPPFYTDEDIETDIRDLYFNLEDGDLQYFQPVRMRGNPRWVKVVDCFDGSIVDVFKIAQHTGGDNGDGRDAFQIAQTYNDNLNNLKDVQTVDLPVQIVPADASLKQAIDVFDRVNSLGTKLSAADLALTHVTGNWPEARRVLKAKIDELKPTNFDFDLSFMTRALVCAVTNHALYEQIHTALRPELEGGWKRLSRTLDYIVNILPNHAFIHSTQDLSTLNTMIPLIQFLHRNGGVFPTDEVLHQALHWFLIAQIHQRYTGQTDSKLEHDVTIVLREESPWTSLLDQIVDQRGRIDVNPNDFEGRGTWHPLYKMTFILTKASQAVDWFNGIPLGTTVGDRYSIHSHHIFPQSILYQNGYSSDNHLHRQIVNAIANRAFLTGETNQSISNRLPEDYLPEVEERYPGALAKQFIPMDAQLWRIDRYPEFLKARRELISTKLNEFIEGFTTPSATTTIRPVSELIGMGEGSNLEFKSTLQWDVAEDKPNKALRDSVLKTLAAFMNTNGGNLLIGVEDSGHVFGLDKDLSLLGGSEDRFLQLLSTLIADKIGPQYSSLVTPQVEEISGKKICVIKISKSSEPAFVDGQQGRREFFIRVGNTTRALDPEQTVSYIESNDL